MKYLIMIYDNAQTREHFTGPDGKELMAEVNALMAELQQSGEMLGGEALADPSQTKAIKPVDGVPAITDGPLAEAKEHFGGYLLVECETFDRAAEIARRWPSARFTPLEVRPLMSQDGAEM
ncbi:MAG TPA: YciI family protein [Baekduia sp.]